MLVCFRLIFARKHFADFDKIDSIKVCVLDLRLIIV
nr:MAG TPA: hypothetical protein [Caudoviricetes sp.]